MIGSVHLFFLFTVGCHLSVVTNSFKGGHLTSRASIQRHSFACSRNDFSIVNQSETTPISHPDVVQANEMIRMEESTSRRRQLLQSFCASVIASLLPPSPSRASIVTDDPPPKETLIVLSGTVILASDIELPKGTESAATTSSSSALYITCRPDKPDNVPQAILNGSRGKAPPVLAARFENPTFPFTFDLVSPTNLTPEGASASLSSSSSLAGNEAIATIDIATEAGQFWWSGDDLIVSARWDSDGVAATRNPEDLVGRGLWKHKGGTDGRGGNVEITLTGRGAFGKLVTGGSKK